MGHKPKRIRDARLRGDHDALSVMGKAGARARARRVAQDTAEKEVQAELRARRRSQPTEFEQRLLDCGDLPCEDE